MDADALDKVMMEGHRIYVEGLREQCKIPADWTYRRTPFATDEAVEQMFDLLGAGNYQVVSGYGRDGSQSLSVFISPEGMKRINDYINTQKPEPSP